MAHFIKGPEGYINLDNVTHISPLKVNGQQQGFEIHFVGQAGKVAVGMMYEQDFDRLLILSSDDRLDRRGSGGGGGS